MEDVEDVSPECEAEVRCIYKVEGHLLLLIHDSQACSHLRISDLGHCVLAELRICCFRT
jgi:hypothetical protein